MTIKVHKIKLKNINLKLYLLYPIKGRKNLSKIVQRALINSNYKKKKIS